MHVNIFSTAHIVNLRVKVLNIIPVVLKPHVILVSITMASSTADSDDANWSLYPYNPSFALPIIFAVILLLAGVFQAYQSFRRRGWRIFGRFMLVATIVWLGGFIVRAVSAKQQQNVPLFITQFVLIYAGPPLFGAAELFILGRLLAYLPYHAPLHPGRVVSTFMILSAATESLTGSGASNSAAHYDDPAAQRTGHQLLQAALVLQAVMEVGFFSIVAVVNVRCRRAGHLPPKIRTVIMLLYVTSAMLLVRCVVRAIEAFESSGCLHSYCGYAATHEWVLWVFEVANITLFVILLAVFHPSRFLPPDNKVFLDPVDGTTERLGPGYSDHRPFWQTVMDPWNLGAVLFGRGVEVEKFWEEEQPVYKSNGLDGQRKASVTKSEA